MLSIAVVFFSCRDDSGDFEEQIFTNDQITLALRDCIKVTSDTTINVLCIVDTLEKNIGYYYYSDSIYRIELSAAAKQVIDTLRAYEFENIDEIIDSLTFNINRGAEQCGKAITDFWEPIIKNFSFPNPNKTLHGNSTAITDYVKATQQSELINLMKNYTLKENLTKLGVFTTWTMLLEEYYEITGSLLTIDILDYSVQQMVNGFFKEMALWEEKVRENPELRGKEDGWLYKVFATL
jgi:hypothetical protein